MIGTTFTIINNFFGTITNDSIISINDYIEGEGVEDVDKILVTNKLQFTMKTVRWLTLYRSLNVNTR